MRIRRGALVGLAIVIGLILIVWRLDLRLTWNPQTRYEAANAQWEAANITDYRIVVDAQIPYRAQGVYEVIVREGGVESTTVYTSAMYRLDPDPTGSVLDPMQGEAFTVDALLTQARLLTRTLNRIHLSLGPVLVFDEAVGYPEIYRDNACGPLNVVEQCVTSYRVLVFERLQ